MVLGCGTDHGGTADVDLLDRFGIACLAGDGLLEGIQVDHDELEGIDPPGLEIAEVLVITEVGEDPTVDVGMERLDPSTKHLGSGGDVGNTCHRDPGIAEVASRSARGDDLNTGGAQTLGEVDEAGLVGYRDEGPVDRNGGH